MKITSITIKDGVKNAELNLSDYLTCNGGSLTGDLTSSSGAHFKRVQESVVEVNNGVCNCAEGSFFIITPTTDTTISLSNMAAGQVISIKIINGGSHKITYPAEWLWLGGSTPELQTSGMDMIVVSYDGFNYIVNTITNLTHAV